MKQKLRTLNAEHHGAYGFNRLTLSMNLSYPQLERRQVHRFKRDLCIRGKSRHRGSRTTVPDHRPHGIPYRIKCNFTASVPRQLVVCDPTAIPLMRGVACLAIVLDVYSRKILGWAMDAEQSAMLMIRALKQVIAREPCEAMICHSDQGSQYISRAYKTVCQAHGIKQSTGSVGGCYDNTMAESFFATLKTECQLAPAFESLDNAKATIGAYIDDYYNAVRLHSSVNYRTPNDMEQSFK